MNNFTISQFTVEKSFRDKRTLLDFVLGRNKATMYHHNVRFMYSGAVLKPGILFVVEGGVKFMVKSSERLVSVNRDENWAEALTIKKTLNDFKSEKPSFGVISSSVK